MTGLNFRRAGFLERVRNTARISRREEVGAVAIEVF